MNELKPFQIEGSEFLRDNRSALLADEMRLGKTPQAIRATDLVKAKRILVTCPATVKIHWARKFAEWSERKLDVDILYGKKAKINKHAHVTILNYDIAIQYPVWKQIVGQKWSVSICDESHYLGGHSSERTQAYLKPFGIIEKCYYRWFLAGTPILSKPKEIYPVLAACAPEAIKPYTTWDSFARHFCGGAWVGNGFGRKFVADGATNKKELNRRLRKFMLRRLKKDVWEQLPKKTYELIPIPQVGSNLKKLVAEEFKMQSGSMNYTHEVLQGEDYSVIRHELALYKLSFAVRHIKMVMEGTKKLVIFAHHRDVVKKLRDQLEAYNPVIVMGGMSDIAKQKSMDSFQDNKDTHIIIGNIQAAGTGTDFSAADHIIFIEGANVPGHLQQAMDRCDGFELDKGILIQFLVIRESVEENIMFDYLKKSEDISEIVDGYEDLLN